MKDLNKKEAVGDLLDAFKEVSDRWCICSFILILFLPVVTNLKLLHTH